MPGPPSPGLWRPWQQPFGGFNQQWQSPQTPMQQPLSLQPFGASSQSVLQPPSPAQQFVPQPLPPTVGALGQPREYSFLISGFLINGPRTMGVAPELFTQMDRQIATKGWADPEGQMVSVWFGRWHEICEFQTIHLDDIKGSLG